MPSLKIKLKTTPLNDGSFPIVLQIIKDRKRKIITTGLTTEINFWDNNQGCFKTKFSNHRTSNQLLDKLKIRARNIISQFEMDEIDYTLNQFEEKFRIGSSSQRVEVFSFWLSIIENMEDSKKRGNAKVNKDTLRSIKKYHLKKELYFSDIDVAFLDNYEVFLRTNGGTDGGIGVKMRAIRAIFNTSIRRGATRASIYPFKSYKISKLKGKGTKHYLSLEEIEAFKQVDCSNDLHLTNAQNYFLFSFYTRGMNFVDMMKLKWQNVLGDRIIYKRQKTNGVFSIKILTPAQKLLDFYKGLVSTTSYVFPILLHEGLNEKQIENRKHKILSQYNSDLKIIAERANIDKNLTSYVARHSFAMCLRDKGIGLDLISESLGHSELKTTKSYVREFGVKVLDDAAEVLL